MKKIILQAFFFGLFIYSCLFFWQSLLSLPFWNNACADRGLSKMICHGEIIYEYDVDMNINNTRSKRKFRVSRITPYNFLRMKMYCMIAVRTFIIITLGACFHEIKQWKSQDIESQQWKQTSEAKIITGNWPSQNNNKIK